MIKKLIIIKKLNQFDKSTSYKVQNLSGFPKLQEKKYPSYNKLCT